MSNTRTSEGEALSHSPFLLLSDVVVRVGCASWDGKLPSRVGKRNLSEYRLANASRKHCEPHPAASLYPQTLFRYEGSRRERRNRREVKRREGQDAKRNNKKQEDKFWFFSSLFFSDQLVPREENEPNEEEKQPKNKKQRKGTNSNRKSPQKKKNLPQPARQGKVRLRFPFFPYLVMFLILFRRSFRVFAAESEGVSESFQSPARCVSLCGWKRRTANRYEKKREE